MHIYQKKKERSKISNLFLPRKLEEKSVTYALKQASEKEKKKIIKTRTEII